MGSAPDASRHDAVRAAREWVQSGKTWVVDIDLEAFFDQVYHDLLLQQLIPICNLRSRIVEEIFPGNWQRGLRWEG